MKTVRLWGGSGDGGEFEVSDTYYEERRPVVVKQANEDGSLLPDREQEVYIHHQVWRKYDHPCVRWLDVVLLWNAWVRDYTADERLAEMIATAQPPDECRIVEGDFDY